MAVITMERELDSEREGVVVEVYRAFGMESPGAATRTLRIELKDIGLPNLAMLEKTVVVTLGEPQRKNYVDRIPVEWSVPKSTIYPVFRGFFDVQPASKGRTRLTLAGYYHPPFNGVGALFDAVAGRRIAEATIRHLLEEIVRAVKARRLDTP